MTNENVNDTDIKDTDSVNTHQKDENTVTVDLYDANHGKTPRTGGPYLDDIERRNAETWRAQKEDREPDYDNPPAVVSTVLVPKSQLVERDTDKSHFSDALEVTNEPVATYDVVTPEEKPDPTQPDFDNNYDRLNALNAGVKLNDLKDQATSRGGVSAQPDAPEVVTQDNPQPQGTADDFNADVGNADNPEGIWNAPASDGENKVN